MPEPLKNSYTPTFVEQLLTSYNVIDPQLNKKEVHDFVFGNGWKELELKARISRLAKSMELFLPSAFPKAAPVVCELITKLHDDNHSVASFEYMFIPEYVEKNGIDYPELSFEALKHITQYTSCEFAIRPFIIKYEERSMEFMLSCSLSSHQNVRRFASEGCRSRLPWAMALPRFKKDASLNIPILENLKADNSLFVRKSVANNLNDISKNHESLALELAQKWHGEDENTNWIVKHGMRTLLKEGNPSAMELFGYANINYFEISAVKILTPAVQFGKSLLFEFKLRNKTRTEQKIRLEYAIYFLKNNGTQSKKVFKISERTINSQELLTVEKQHKLVPISTRKYYQGEHALSVIINGVEFEKHVFLLNM